jgi:AcrR family transcriptional regulator
MSAIKHYGSLEAKRMEVLLIEPKTKRGQATLALILEVAEHILSEKGYSETSVTDITKAAGIGTGTFYQYFPGKLELYKYLIEECGKQIVETMKTNISPEGLTRREIEKAGIRSWLQLARDKPQYYRIIWESLFVDKEIFISWYKKFFTIYEQGIKNGQSEGTVKQFDSEVLAYTLMGAANFLGMYLAILNKEGNKWDLDYITDEYMKIFEQGVFLE